MSVLATGYVGNRVTLCRALPNCNGRQTSHVGRFLKITDFFATCPPETPMQFKATMWIR